MGATRGMDVKVPQMSLWMASAETSNPCVLGSNPSRLTNLPRYSSSDARHYLARAGFGVWLTATLTATSNARGVLEWTSVVGVDAEAMSFSSQSWRT